MIRADDVRLSPGQGQAEAVLSCVTWSRAANCLASRAGRLHSVRQRRCARWFRMIRPVPDGRRRVEGPGPGGAPWWI